VFPKVVHASPGTIALVDAPILRATDASGEVYDDPSEDALYMFMEGLVARGSSIRVERLDDERKGDWAQVAVIESGLYRFESSDHVKYVSSLRAIHELLTRWSFDLGK
jgi:hypothetical protein